MEVLNDYNFAVENVRKKEALKLKDPTEKVGGHFFGVFFNLLLLVMT